MVLSLTLCQVPPPEEYYGLCHCSNVCTADFTVRITWARKMHESLVDRWCATSDLTTLEDLGVRISLVQVHRALMLQLR